MMIWGYGYAWPMMLWMFFWNFLWLALLGIAIWSLVRWLVRSPSQSTHQRTLPAEPSALEILQQRYARGEIDAVTYEQMRERIEGSRQQYPISS